MLHMMAKRVILIQQGTFKKYISVIVLTYSGKTSIAFPFPMMELVILNCLCPVCVLSEKVDFA
jgi:hypothetical protein